jgi:hypothetical protein
MNLSPKNLPLFSSLKFSPLRKGLWGFELMGAICCLNYMQFEWFKRERLSRYITYLFLQFKIRERPAYLRPVGQHLSFCRAARIVTRDIKFINDEKKKFIKFIRKNLTYYL